MVKYLEYRGLHQLVVYLTTRLILECSKGEIKEMEKAYLDCLLREEKGKNKVNALRRSGFVPAVVYGQGKNVLPATQG